MTIRGGKNANQVSRGQTKCQTKRHQRLGCCSLAEKQNAQCKNGDRKRPGIGSNDFPQGIVDHFGIVTHKGTTHPYHAKDRYGG